VTITGEGLTICDRGREREENCLEALRICRLARVLYGVLAVVGCQPLLALLLLMVVVVMLCSIHTSETGFGSSRLFCNRPGETETSFGCT